MASLPDSLRQARAHLERRDLSFPRSVDPSILHQPADAPRAFWRLVVGIAKDLFSTDSLGDQKYSTLWAPWGGNITPSP